MQARKICVVIALVVGGGCGPSAKHKTDGGNGGDGSIVDTGPLPHTLSAITITPDEPIIELDLNTSAAIGFTATGNYADGVDEDLTNQVTWTLLNPAVGTLAGASLSIPGFATATAVTSKVTADYNGVQGLNQITVVAYRKSGPQQDFFFILPYQDPMGQVAKPLDFSTAIPALDVFFLMDTTGSMSGEIANLKSALTGTVVPGIQNAVTNSQFGVGAFEDFPVSPYGSTNCASSNTPDQPFKLLQTITPTTSAVQTGVNALANATGSPIGCGSDLPEAGLEGIYQVATGEGLSSPSPTSVPANHTGVGGVKFRAGTMPVVVAITDANSHGPGETSTCTSGSQPYAGAVATVAHSRAQVKTALGNICARLVGVAAIPGGDAGCTGQEYLEDLATTTGARVPPAAWDVGTRPAGCAANQCCTDYNGAGRAPDGDGLCPVVFRVQSNGTGLGTNIVTGIQMLTRFATFDVLRVVMGLATDVDGNALPGGHTTADFLKTIAPVSYVLPPPPPVLPPPTFDATTFHGVTPGTQVTFTIDAFNDFVPQVDHAQIFRATIQVLAGGCTPLDQRDVLILVPPTPITIQ
jgi:Integrin beta chain VWA domain